MARESVWSRLLDRVLGGEIARRVSLAVRVLDDVNDRVWNQSTFPRDRHGYDRDEVLRDALDAWRSNPLARRIVSLTSQYVVGGGIAIEVRGDREANEFVQEWWRHRLNRMLVRAFEWCDELTRTGNLFVVVATDAAGMSYVRAIPAYNVEDIETAPNDVEQVVAIKEKPTAEGGVTGQGRRWVAYDERLDARADDGTFEPVVLHYAINRPVGAKWGESDLAPVTRWLVRYSAWLEDRVRLNRFRQMFLFVVSKAWRSEDEREARQAGLNGAPPGAGAILCKDESETWEVLGPKLDSFEAASDGLAIKKMIAGGSGIPLHYLAEPESSTRTTAESAGGSTYRHFEQRQQFFVWLLGDVARVVLRRRAMVDRTVDGEAEVASRGTDLSGRDNAALAVATVQMVEAIGRVRDRGLIDDAEMLRLVYRFAGEVVDVPEMLERGKRAPRTQSPNGSRPPELKVDEMGDVKTL